MKLKREDSDTPFWVQMRAAERGIIQFALNHAGSVKAAAAALGLKARFLYGRLYILKLGPYASSAIKRPSYITPSSKERKAAALEKKRVAAKERRAAANERRAARSALRRIGAKVEASATPSPVAVATPLTEAPPPVAVATPPPDGAIWAPPTESEVTMFNLDKLAAEEDPRD
jgi:hypothetical protein